MFFPQHGKNMETQGEHGKNMETRRTWEEHGNTEHGKNMETQRTLKHRENLNNTEWPYEQKDNC